MRERMRKLADLRSVSATGAIVETSPAMQWWENRPTREYDVMYGPSGSVFSVSNASGINETVTFPASAMR